MSKRRRKRDVVRNNSTLRSVRFYDPRPDIIHRPVRNVLDMVHKVHLEPQRDIVQGVADNRRFHVSRVDTIPRLNRVPVTEYVPRGKYGQFLGFRDAHNVLTCVRRKQRKQVLFAKRKAGCGGQKKPRWSALSRIRC